MTLYTIHYMHVASGLEGSQNYKGTTATCAGEEGAAGQGGPQDHKKNSMVAPSRELGGREGNSTVATCTDKGAEGE